MKREYKDLSIDEKKEYHIYKNLTLEIPFMLLLILSTLLGLIIAIYVTPLDALGFGLIMIIFTLIYYKRDRREARKLFGL